MKIIKGSVNSGKTTEIIKLCAEQGEHIVCYDKKEAHYVDRLAKQLNIDVPSAIMFREFLDGRC